MIKLEDSLVKLEKKKKRKKRKRVLALIIILSYIIRFSSSFVVFNVLRLQQTGPTCLLFLFSHKALKGN